MPYDLCELCEKKFKRHCEYLSDIYNILQFGKGVISDQIMAESLTLAPCQIKTKAQYQMCN